MTLQRRDVARPAAARPRAAPPRTGGYRRFAWTREDADLRDWFTGEAKARGLDVAADRAGNLVAWWGDPDADGPGVVTGSHLDSVPDGGAFDGPLGVVSAFAALDALRADGFRPARPLGVACFGDEEGARFGVACAGSRILTGALDRRAGRRARRRRRRDDGRGRHAGRATPRWGPDPEALRRIGTFVELHVEQGRALADLGRAVARRHRRSTRTAAGASTWPGRADHAGTTRLVDRDDPMLAFARVVLAARAAAERHGAVATCGKVHVAPNGVNAIPSHVTAWLDARGEDAERVRAVVGGRRRGSGRGHRGVVDRPHAVRPGAAARLAALLDDAPLLPTGAGHDAGVLAAAGVPTAMLYVRNPTGISHSPEEHAEDADCAAGVTALGVLRDWRGGR